MKRDDKFGCLAALAVIAAAILLATIMNSCSSNGYVDSTWHRADSLSLIAQQDTARWAQFIECSRYEGDAGCDSCFTMIYGYSLEDIILGNDASTAK